jgi:hypothetical protein
MNTTKTSLDNTYWFDNGRLQSMHDQLLKLIPDEGDFPSDQPKANRLLKALRLYYDIYNNGGCNCAREIRSFFGASANAACNDDADAIAKIEKVMDKAILDAFHEANL